MGMRLCIALFATSLLSFVSFGQTPATGARDLILTSGKSVVVDSPVNIERVSVANADIAEAVVTSPREVLVNGKAPGETTLIVWQQGGNRLFFDVYIRRNNARIQAVQRELTQELGRSDVTLDVQDDTVFIRGTVQTLSESDRAMVIASTIGKPVNLLRVAVPPVQTQILLKVKFADIDRATALQLGANFFSTGAGNTIGRTAPGLFPAPAPSVSQTNNSVTSNFTISDALNVFLFRPDLNLAATIALLQGRSLLQILAEPNVLAIDGHPASFLAGGEFPFPTLQGGGAGLGAVTIQFREFGVRLNFTPTVTPRGTIRLVVAPEVSALDASNGLTIQGFTIPAISTRRVTTEIELENGQSFAIAGLLDNRVTDAFNKIPGLGNIPFFGKLFQSRSRTRNNSELLVVVTPEIVRPIPAGMARPELKFPEHFLPPNTSAVPPQTPGLAVTGPVPVSAPPRPAIPVEELMRLQQQQGPSLSPAQVQGLTPPPVQFVPAPYVPMQQPQSQPARPPQQASPPAAAPGAPAGQSAQ